MRAVVLNEYGGPEVLRLQEVPEPDVGPDEMKVNVAYTALNRADLLQRMGAYPPPEPAPAYEIPGLEFAGTVEQVGHRVTRWRPGDRVFGLLTGGGYAEKVVTHQDMALPVPDNLSLAEAAAVAEVFFTAYDALINRAKLRAGERVLVHAGGSGVGTAAIQLAKAMGASTVLATVGSAAKAQGVRQLGAQPILYKEEDFVAAATDRDVAAIPESDSPEAASDREVGDIRGVLATRRLGGIQGSDATQGNEATQGVDVILDFVGSPYLSRNMQAAALLGRIVVIGLLGGAKGEIDLGMLMRKRLTVVGTVLRSRSLAEKLTLTAQFAKHVLPMLADGRLRPIIDREFPLSEVAAAHQYMAANKNFGKVLLRIRP